MPKHRSITPAQMRDMLLTQAEERGHPIRCALCGGYILPGDQTMTEHLHALGLGGADAPDNRRLVHHVCGMKKTNGTAATTAGSDKNLMAKHRRLTGKNKPRRKRKVPADPRPWSERWPQSQFVKRPGKPATRRDQ